MGFDVLSELRFFFPRISLFFLIAMVYNLLRPLKISLILSAPHSCGEVIPYLKVWGVLPGAFLFTYLFTRLQGRMNRERVFYSMVSLFFVFFVFFALVLFPGRDFWELTSLGDWLAHHTPPGLAGLVAMIRYWHYTLFYLFSELWGSVVLSMLFWGFINETTPLSQAKRFYGVFAFGANLASIAAGKLGMTFSNPTVLESFPVGATHWEKSVYTILGITLISCCLIVPIFSFLNRSLVLSSQDQPKNPSHKKETFTLMECFRGMIQTPYLRYLALIVFGYNIVFNLTDVLWTNQLRLYFSGRSLDLNNYMSQVTFMKGILAATIALCLSGPILNRLGWRFTALITPGVLAITSLIFFPLVLMNETSSLALSLSELFQDSILGLSVFIGGVQNCLTRASKYTVFDATKEIAYIPLSHMDQRKGKAVIDGIGSRIGKSGGSISFQALLIFCSSIAATTPYVAVIIGIVIGMWIVSVYKLNGLMGQEKLPDHQV